MLVLRMFPRFKNSITTRSEPTPHPPCGNAPYLNASMYAWIVSTSMPHSTARFGEQRRVVDALRAGDDLLAADEDVGGVEQSGWPGPHRKTARRRRVLGEHVKVGVVFFLDELPEDALVLGAEVPERVHALDAGLFQHRDPLRKLQSKRRSLVLEGLVRELLGHDLSSCLNRSFNPSNMCRNRLSKTSSTSK